MRIIRFSSNLSYRGKPEEQIDSNGKKYFVYTDQVTQKRVKINLGYNFYNKEYSVSEFFKHLTVDGYPVAPYLNSNNGRPANRCEANFEASSILLLDFDNEHETFSIRDLKQSTLYKKYGSGLYTTASHTEHRPRFRAIFILEVDILKSTDMRLLYESFLRQYSCADKACKDPCRAYNGSINAEIVEQTGRILPAIVMMQMIADEEKQQALDKETWLLSKQKTRKLTNKLSLRRSREVAFDDIGLEPQRFLDIARSTYVGKYVDWRNFGYAMAASGFSFDDFLYVTYGMMRKKSDVDAEKIWNSFSNETCNVSIGTAFYILKKYNPIQYREYVRERKLEQLLEENKKLTSCKRAVYIDALPGAGKSFYIKNRIRKRGGKYIIVVPTKALMRQYAEDLGNAIRVMSGHGKNVALQLSRAIDSNDQIILITHKCLTKCIDYKLFLKCRSYNLIIDEVVDCFISHFVLGLDASIGKGGILRDVCGFEGFENNELIKLSIQDDEEYEKCVNRIDEKRAVFLAEDKKLLKTINNPTKSVYASRLNANNFGITVEFNVKMLENFRSIVVLSACIKHTSFFHLLAANFHLVSECPDSIMQRMLQQQQRYAKVCLMYLTENSYSKSYSQRTRFCLIEDETHARQYFAKYGEHSRNTINSQTYASKIIRAEGMHDCIRGLNQPDFYREEITNRFGEIEYVYRLTGDSSVVPEEVISVISHGLNNFKNCNSVAYVVSLNKEPWVTRFLHKRLPYYDAEYEQNTLGALQFISRTSIRDVDSNKTVKVLLADYQTAYNIWRILGSKPRIREHCLYHDYVEYSVKKCK